MAKVRPFASGTGKCEKIGDCHKRRPRRHVESMTSSAAVDCPQDFFIPPSCHPFSRSRRIHHLRCPSGAKWAHGHPQGRHLPRVVSGIQRHFYCGELWPASQPSWTGGPPHPQGWSSRVAVERWHIIPPNSERLYGYAASRPAKTRRRRAPTKRKTRNSRARIALRH